MAFARDATAPTSTRKVGNTLVAFDRSQGALPLSFGTPVPGSTSRTLNSAQPDLSFSKSIGNLDFKTATPLALPSSTGSTSVPTFGGSGFLGNFLSTFTTSSPATEARADREAVVRSADSVGAGFRGVGVGNSGDGGAQVVLAGNGGNASATGINPLYIVGGALGVGLLYYLTAK